MTAPDVNADVRARFEAWASDDGKWPKAVERTGYNDGYRLMATHLYWLAWQAAHADLAGEVRELVEVVQALERACDEDLIANTSHEDSVGVLSDAAKAALAKFHPTHQEKP